MNLSLLLIIFSFKLNAQELERYCFKSPGQKKMATQEYRQFKLSEESLLNVSALCFDLVVQSKKRIEFWDSFLHKRHGGINQTASQFKPEECRLKLETTRYTTELKNKLNLSKRPQFLKNKNQSEMKEESFLRILSGKQGQLLFDGEELNFICTYKNKDLYSIEFSRKVTEVKNINYLINGIPFWKQLTETKEHLTTSLQLNKGQRIEISSINRDKNESDNSLDIPSHLSQEKIDYAISQKTFLTIE